MKLPVDVSITTGQPPIQLAHEVAAGILRIVENGWERVLASSKVGADAGEVEITEQLRDGMRQAANERSIKINMELIVVLSGTESRSRPNLAIPDGRTDIPLFLIEIFLHYGVHDPHAVIECKKVAGSRADLCRAYVMEGIDRFRSGKYGGNHSVGFMTGYLVADDAQSAASGINRYLERKSRTAESLDPSDLVIAPWAWRSVHVRGNNVPIRLHHAFLAFAATIP